MEGMSTRWTEEEHPDRLRKLQVYLSLRTPSPVDDKLAKLC